MSEEEKIRILYVDDDEHNLNSFKASFRRKYDVHIAESAYAGFELLKEHDFHIILTDQRMPSMTGVEFLEQVIKKYPDPIRMLVTGYTDIEAVIDAINKGKVYNYIKKPWEEDDLIVMIENAYEVYDLRRKNAELIKKLEEANEQLEFLLRQRLLD